MTDLTGARDQFTKLDALEPHPQAHLVPDASPEDDAALLEDVAENGVYIPIIHHEGRILDGHRRYRAAKEAGLSEVPAIRKHGLTEDEEIELLVKLNGNRRQWSPAQKRETAGQLREKGWSYRRIAGVLGVGKSTVKRWVDELSQAGQLNEPGEVVGRDGKTRPASHDTEPTDEPAAEAEPENQGEARRDAGPRDSDDDPFSSLPTLSDREREALEDKRARQAAEKADEGEDEKVVELDEHRDTRTQDEWVRDEKQDAMQEVEESPFGRVLDFLGHVIEEPETFTDEEIREAVRDPNFPTHWMRTARHVHETLGRIIATAPEADEGDDHVSAR